MKRLGFVVPSSNTVLEPVTAEMCNAIADLSVHFARIRVTRIALSAAANKQFDYGSFIAAADLLADAKIDLVAWNGTSGSWLGLDYDRALCDAIERGTGVPATTSTLAYHEVLGRAGITRVALVTPYTRDVQDRIAAVWSRNGIDCVAERHLGLEDNWSFGRVTDATISGMVEAVGRSGVEAVVILCTNMLGARLAARCEAALGIPVLDSVSVTLRGCLDRLGLDSRPLAPDWGRIFEARGHPVRTGRVALDARVGA